MPSAYSRRILPNRELVSISYIDKLQCYGSVADDRVTDDPDDRCLQGWKMLFPRIGRACRFVASAALVNDSAQPVVYTKVNWNATISAVSQAWSLGYP